MNGRPVRAILAAQCGVKLERVQNRTVHPGKRLGRYAARLPYLDLAPEFHQSSLAVVARARAPHVRVGVLRRPLRRHLARAVEERVDERPKTGHLGVEFPARDTRPGVGDERTQPSRILPRFGEAVEKLG